MTAVSLHVAAPTRTEGVLLRLADALTCFVARRQVERAARRERMRDLVHAQQIRRSDPRAVEHLLAQMGVPRR